MREVKSNNVCPASHPEGILPQIYQPFGRKKRFTDFKGPSRGSLIGMLKEHYEGGSVYTAVYFFKCLTQTFILFEVLSEVMRASCFHFLVSFVLLSYLVI